MENLQYIFVKLLFDFAPLRIVTIEYEDGEWK